MRLSVIIPTYNRAALLRQTLHSVLAQTRLPDEIIVVDDGSTDDTRAVVHSYGSPVRYVYQENARQSAARNTGQRAAMGDLLLFLDSDDLLLPEALAELERALEAAPNAALAYCRSQIIDDNNTVIEQQWQTEDGQGDVWYPLIGANFIRSTGCVLLRRFHLERVGDWDLALPGNEDWDMWLRLAESAPFARVDAPLFQYRLHGSNMSDDVVLMKGTALAVYRKHFRRSLTKPKRLRYIARCYRGVRRNAAEVCVGLARSDRSRGDVTAALGKAAFALWLRPVYLFDKNVRQLLFDTWRDARRRRRSFHLRGN